MFKVLAQILILISISTEILSECPEDSLITPCICIHQSPIPCYNWVTSDEIKCNGINDHDLRRVFENLSKGLNKTDKHFERLSLSNGVIHELNENTFKDITFDEIYITGCKNLTTIHENAFNGTDLVTKKLNLSNNPEITFANNSIFNILSKFINVDSINIYGNNKITEIPTNAFRAQPMNKLVKLKFEGSFTKIGTFAFSSLNNLKEMWLVDNYFERIPENAFAFDSPSNVTFDLNLGFIKSNINEIGLNGNSLLNIKRPTILSLVYKSPSMEQHLDERVFLPFLLDNENNTIKVWFSEIDCNDYRNSWFANNNEIAQRVSSTIKRGNFYRTNVCPN